MAVPYSVPSTLTFAVHTMLSGDPSPKGLLVVRAQGKLGVPGSSHSQEQPSAPDRWKSKEMSSFLTLWSGTTLRPVLQFPKENLLSNACPIHFFLFPKSLPHSQTSASWDHPLRLSKLLTLKSFLTQGLLLEKPSLKQMHFQTVIAARRERDAVPHPMQCCVK